MKLKLLLLLALFNVMTFAEDTVEEEEKDDDNPFTNPALWKRPEYKGYPYARANHPVVYYEDGNGENQILNFCGNQFGFEVEDFTKECFLGPFIMSIAIPPFCFFIVFLFICYSSCIVSCTRCCCGPCCLADDMCCCVGDGTRKAYKLTDWIVFLVITLVLVICVQIPFFIVGIVGNAGMTVALGDVSGSILDIYPKAKELSEDFIEFVESIDFSTIEEIGELLGGFGGGDDEEGTEEEYKRSPLRKYLSQQKQSKKQYKKKATLKKEGEEEDESGNPLQETIDTVKEMINEVFTYGDSIMYYVELVVTILLIVREVMFDIILILPLFGGILMAIGGCAKIHQMAISFFPCSFVFSFIAIIFIALEYPMTTLIADVCVVYYNVLEQSESATVYEIKTFEDLMNLTEMSTGDLINQALLVLDDCEHSLLGDVKGTINAILDNTIDSLMTSINLTDFTELLSVCDLGESKGLFYYYDTARGDSYGYDKCLSNDAVLPNTSVAKQNTECVFGMYDDALDSGKKEEPLLICKEGELNRNPSNKLEELLNILVSFKNIELINSNVYWVNEQDLNAYMAETQQSMNLDDAYNKYGDLIEEYLKIFGFGEEDVGSTDVKRSQRKAATFGHISAFCANVDGKIADNGEYHGQILGGDNPALDGYMMTSVSCSPLEYIPVTKCAEECPRLVGEMFESMGNITSAIDFIEELRDVIVKTRETIDKITEFVGCSTISGIADGIKISICQEYLEAEVLLVVGLVAYSIVLWVMYIFGLLAIKRFNRDNYEYVDTSTRYYAEGEVEMN